MVIDAINLEIILGRVNRVKIVQIRGKSPTFLNASLCQLNDESLYNPLTNEFYGVDPALRKADLNINDNRTLAIGI